MSKALLVVTQLLLAFIGGFNASCFYRGKIKPLDINIDEYANKRSNIIYVSESDMQFDTIYMELWKKSNNSYIVNFVATRSDHWTVFQTTVSTYSDGIMHIIGDATRDWIQSRKNRPKYYKWMVIGKTDDGALLVYNCDDDPDYDDRRYILAPTNIPLGVVSVYKRFPIDSIVSKESLTELLAIDKSYNFTGTLKKLPYGFKVL